MNKWFALLLFSFSACSAHMGTPLSKSTPYAPINEINGGTMSYLNQGVESVITKRRQNAYKKMHDYCRGDYRIIEEGERVGDAIISPIGNTLFVGTNRHWKIKFECVHQDQKLPIPPPSPDPA
jgi:hypothetical protein